MTGRRLTPGKVEGLLGRLSDRDRSIVADFGRVGVLTGAQITRRHFADLSPTARDRVRRRVLARLARLDVLAMLDRRIGGARAGSAGLVFALGVAGQRLLPMLDVEVATDLPARARQPWTPGVRFLAHSLAVSELYVRLREQEAAGTLKLARWAAEPNAWFSNGFGGFVKPDASLLLQAGDIEDSWVVEVDRATESLTTLRRKLLVYVDFAHAGQLGPDGVIPRVMVAMNHDKPAVMEKRFTAVQGIIAGLPEPATRLIYVARFQHAVPRLLDLLKQ